MADPVEDLLPLLGINHEENRESESEISNSSDTSVSDSDTDEGSAEDREEGNPEDNDYGHRRKRRHEKQKRKNRNEQLTDKGGASGPGKSKVTVNFDKTLPGEHSYLGNDLEDLRGRTILEENSIVTLPVLILPNIVLVPGQVIPLQLYVQRIVAMVRHAAETDKTFGVLNVKFNEEDSGKISGIGCTAELFSMKEEMDDLTGISMIRAKARGRQRFKVINSLITEITGDVKAKVRILPEQSLSHVLEGAQLPSLRRFLVPSAEDEDDMIKTAVDRQGQVLISVDLRQRHVINKLFAGHFTWWPPWVYKMYDIEWLSEQIGIELQGWSSTSLPDDPVELSYWVAHNLPVDDETRLLLLSLDSVVQRLRFGLSVIRKSGVSLCCTTCQQEISSKKHIFSMSQEGPLGAFVNPGGYVHEMFTVLETSNLSHIGQPSTEHSWFPGYAWTIAQCKSCHSHRGWMFSATKRGLSPYKFWGLCRSSIKTVLSVDTENADQPIYIK